jgi:hypothetical protein
MREIYFYAEGICPCGQSYDESNSSKQNNQKKRRTMTTTEELAAPGVSIWWMTHQSRRPDDFNKYSGNQQLCITNTTNHVKPRSYS